MNESDEWCDSAPAVLSSFSHLHTRFRLHFDIFASVKE
jgi:hypothetical protein